MEKETAKQNEGKKPKTILEQLLDVQSGRTSSLGNQTNTTRGSYGVLIPMKYRMNTPQILV